MLLLALPAFPGHHHCRIRWSLGWVGLCGLHSFPTFLHVILVAHDVKPRGNHCSVFTMPLSNICARGNFLPHILPCLVAKVTIQQTHWCSLPLEGQSSWGVILPILPMGLLPGSLCFVTASRGLC